MTDNRRKRKNQQNEKKTAAFATKSGCTVMWVVKIGLSFSETPHRDTVSVKSIYQEHFSL